MKKRKTATVDLLGIAFRIASAAIWGLLVLAGGMFWNPSFRSWGVCIAGLGILMSFWLMSGFLRRRNSVHGNAVQWVWLAMILFLTAIQFTEQFIAPKLGCHHPARLEGTITISLIIQFTLIMLASMLAGEFLAEGQVARWLRESICCFMVLIYFAINLLVELYDTGFIHSGLWFCGVAGVALAGANAFSPSSNKKEIVGFQMINYQHRAAVTAQLIVAGVGLVGMLFLAKAELFAISLLVSAMIASLWWADFRFGRKIMYYWAALLAVAIIALGILWCPSITLTLLGQGESAFIETSSKGNGFGVMLGMIGLGGMAIFVGGLMWISAKAVAVSEDRSIGEKIRSLLWLAGCWLSVFGLWSGGAFFSLTTTITMAFAWGLLPAMAKMNIKSRSAWRFIAIFVIFAFWLNVSNNLTLVQKVAVTFGKRDLLLHALAGFTLCLILAWLVGKRRWQMPYIAIVAAIGIGALGEYVQKLISRRTLSMQDWQYHSKGVVIAAVIVLIVMAARYKRFTGASKDIEQRVGKAGKLLRISGMIGCLIALATGVIILFNITFKAIHGSKLHDVDILASDKLTPAEQQRRIEFRSKFIMGDTPNTFLAIVTTPSGSKMVPAWNSGSHHNRNGMCRASFPTGKLKPGLLNAIATADPYSEVGYLRKPFKFQVVGANQSMVIIDAYAALDWLKTKHDFAQEIKELSPAHTPVVLYGGTLIGYRNTRKFIRKQLPDVPVLGCNVPDKWQLASAASRAAIDMRYRNHPIVILAENPLAAWVIFRYFYQKETKIFIVGDQKLSKEFVASHKNGWKFKRFTQNSRRFKTVEEALKAISKSGK